MRIIIFLCLAVSAWSATLEGISFPETLREKDKDYVLNGVGLRVKRKLGIGFRVYVAALYMPAKTQDAAQVLASGERIVDLVFLRSLDRETMQEALAESVRKNCLADCEKIGEPLTQLKELITDVQKDSRLRLRIDREGVSVQTEAKTKTSGRITSSTFGRNLMAAFVGQEPPTEDLKKGLLGL